MGEASRRVGEARPARLRRELERLGCPRSVPWRLLAPHEKQALRNHGQTMQRLAERGGLSPAELMCVLEDKHWSERVDDAAAVPDLLRVVAALQPPPAPEE